MAKKATTSNTATKPRKRAKADNPATEQLEQLKPLEVIPPRDEFEFELRELLAQFDNHGVVIDDTQWRELSDEQHRIATQWLANRLVDVLSPVPHFLMLYASEPLKLEVTAYREHQQDVRRHIVPVVFGSPSFKKGDDSPDETKLTLKIPVTHLSDATAGALFRFKRCRVEVSRRDVNEWDQTEFPLMADGDTRIITTDADFTGYKATKLTTDVSFWLDGNLIGPIEAIDWWNKKGSARIEVIGEPLTKGKKGDKVEVAIDGEEQVETDEPKRKPTLPNIEPPEIKIAESDRFGLTVKIIKDKSGWVTEYVAYTPSGWESERDSEEKGLAELPVRQSAKEALEARIGQHVDYWTSILRSDAVKSKFDIEAEVTAIISQLKAWLSGLNRGESIEQIQSTLASK